MFEQHKASELVKKRDQQSFSEQKKASEQATKRDQQSQLEDAMIIGQPEEKPVKPSQHEKQPDQLNHPENNKSYRENQPEKNSEQPSQHEKKPDRPSQPDKASELVTKRDQQSLPVQTKAIQLETPKDKRRARVRQKLERVRLKQDKASQREMQPDGAVLYRFLERSAKGR